MSCVLVALGTAIVLLSGLVTAVGVWSFAQQPRYRRRNSVDGS